MIRAPRVWLVARIGVVALVLAACAQNYHGGWTGFIRFAASTHDEQLPAVRDVPHIEHAGGYDGMFYAQLAVDPLLRDPAIDHALDSPIYRARRILLSWVAHVLGFGKPEWILQVYSAANIAIWLLLAWLLGHVIPVADARSFALWTATMLAQGLIASIWLALTDGPSLLLLMLAAMAVERRRPLVAALILGAAGLTRETNLLGLVLLLPFLDRHPRSWLLVAGCALIAILPLALWMDYLRSVYWNGNALTGSDHITPPLSGLLWKIRTVRKQYFEGVPPLLTALDLAALAALAVQSGVVIWALFTRRYRSAWALLGAAFVGLAIVAKPAVWEGTPGAITRAVLPLTAGAHVILSRLPRPSWWLIGVTALGIIPGLYLLTV